MAALVFNSQFRAYKQVTIFKLNFKESMMDLCSQLVRQRHLQTITNSDIKVLLGFLMRWLASIKTDRVKSCVLLASNHLIWSASQNQGSPAENHQRNTTSTLQGNSYNSTEPNRSLRENSNISGVVTSRAAVFACSRLYSKLMTSLCTPDICIYMQSYNVPTY